MRRAYLVSAALAVVAGVILFGVRLQDRSDPLDGDSPSGQELASLTTAEREWCEDNPGRVAGVAHLEHQSDGAPALFESERLSGDLTPATAEAFDAWAAANPPLYDLVCRTAFETWAGQ